MSFIMPRMTADEMQKALDALKAPPRFPRAEGGFIPPTEPTPQEHDMARPKISHRDEADHWYHVKLTPEVAEREKRHEKVVANALLAIHDDVRRIADALTRDNLHRLLAEESAAERRDEPMDADPDEKAEADVKRLARERDEAEARCERLSVLAEKGERYKALREDVKRTAANAERYSDIDADYREWFALTSMRGLLRGVLRRDDERGRDA